MSNLSAVSPRALSILRIVAGLLFLAHGTTKFFAFPAPFGMPLTTPFMIGGVVELVAGTLIAVGLFTRLAAFIASGDMAVGYIMIHAPKSFWPSVNMGDAAILYCFVFFY